jgi:uncharacterized protein (TIGR02246 family)
MSAIKTLALAAALALPLAACNAPAAPAAVDKAAIGAAVKAVDAGGVADWKARDAAKVAAHYTGDALLIEPFGEPKIGTAAIQAGGAQSFTDPAFSLTYAPDRVEVSDAGDMAVTSGKFEITMTDPASKAVVKSGGNYVTVWKKQADGGWKASTDIASPGPMPAPK